MPRVTADAGLVLVCELDERLGSEAIIVEYLRDPSQGLNTRYRLPYFLRQLLYSRLAGYQDFNDGPSRDRSDFRLFGSPQQWHRGAALTSRCICARPNC